MTRPGGLLTGMETTQGSLFYLTLSFNLPLLSVRKKRRQREEAGGSFVWWVGWGEGKKINGGSLRCGPQPDFWWQLYLLTQTSGDADTNPARSAPAIGGRVRCVRERRPRVQSSTPRGGRPSSVRFPATRRVFTLRAAVSAVDSCRRVLMYLAETF